MDLFRQLAEVPDLDITDMDSKSLCDLLLHRSNDLNTSTNRMIIEATISFIEKTLCKTGKTLCKEYLRVGRRVAYLLVVAAGFVCGAVLAFLCRVFCAPPGAQGIWHEWAWMVPRMGWAWGFRWVGCAFLLAQDNTDAMTHPFPFFFL